MTLPARQTAAGRARLLLASAVALPVFAGATLVSLNSDERSAGPADDRALFAGGIMPTGVRAPTFALRDQDGALVDSRRLQGQPVLVTFVYATCDESCGPQLQLIRGALDDLGRDIPALAISADPRTDTPVLARQFLLEQYMTGRVRFLVGSARELAPIYRGFFVQPQSDTSEHHARIVLVDRRGFQRVGYNLANTTAEDIAHDIRVLERESGGNRTESVESVGHEYAT